MKYGGELVKAEDCDYDSFKQLVPLCPNCKEPVFLRIGGDRLSVKGKEYKIGPHWCHFKGISVEQVAGCEARVSGYTHKDKQRIAAQARGQRLKLLQRWGLSVLTSSPAFSVEDAQTQLKLIRENTTTGSAINYITREIRKDKKRFSTVFFSMTPSVFWKYVKETIPNSVANSPDADIELVRISETLKAGIDVETMPDRQRGLHLLYASEFFWMICSDLQSELLYLMVAATMYGRIKMNAPVVDKEKHVIECFLHVYAVLTTIPWAAEFQRLEAESKQQKTAA